MMRLQNGFLVMGEGLQSPWWGHCNWLLVNTSGFVDLILYYTFSIKIEDNTTPPGGNSVKFVSRESQCFFQQTLIIDK